MVPSLPAFAEPGGYPVRYYALSEATYYREMLTLCPCCAASLASMGEIDTPQAEVAWEGNSEYCDDCGAELPTAYGPVEE